MVGGLVHHEPAADLLLAMPAPKIVRAVHRVEQPVKIDRQHVADRVLHEQILHLGARRRIPVVEQHPHVAPAALDRVQNTLGFLGRRGQRLLGDGVTAGVQRAYDVVVVRGVRGGDDHRVGFGLGQQPVEVFGQLPPGRRPGSADELPGELEAPGVRVAQTDELALFPKGLGDGRDVHARARAQTDDDVATPRRRAGGHAGEPDRHARGGQEERSSIDGDVTRAHGMPRF
jgi:hypothetical protein